MNKHFGFKSLMVSAVMASCALTGCADSSSQECDRVEQGGEVYCVIRKDITETGYDCPSSFANQFDVDGYYVCTNNDNVPPQWPLPLDWDSRKIDPLVIESIGQNDNDPRATLPLNPAPSPNTVQGTCSTTFSTPSKIVVNTKQYNANQQILTQTRQIDNGAVETDFTNEYDAQGRLLKTTSGDTVEIYDYVNGQLVTLTISDPTSVDVSTYTYTNTGLLRQLDRRTTRDNKTNTEQCIYEYDTFKRLTSTVCDEDGKVYATFVLYSADGLIKRMYSDGNANNIYDSGDQPYWFYYYNARGQQERSEPHIEAFGGPTNATQRLYDPKGRHITTQKFADQSPLQKYSYDNQNNPISWTDFREGALIIKQASPVEGALTYKPDEVAGTVTFKNIDKDPNNTLVVSMVQKGSMCPLLRPDPSRNLSLLTMQYELFNWFY